MACRCWPSGGYAALLGGVVDNAGTITVPLGKVGLGSGEQATLDLAGDGFLQVAVPTRAAGTHALVGNSGKISANGGTVQLSAAAARDMARQAVNMSGTIEAKSVGGGNGAIVLGGSDGAVAVFGKMIATSRSSTGGKITVTRHQAGGATLDASGKPGGGTVRIGGERQGGGTVQRAETLTVDAATIINAECFRMGRRRRKEGVHGHVDYCPKDALCLQAARVHLSAKDRRDNVLFSGLSTTAR